MTPGTRKVYESGYNLFRRFILIYGASDSTGIIPFPTEDILTRFIAYCSHVQKLSHSALKVYLAGIRHHFIVAHGRDPFMGPTGPLLRLRMLVRAVKRLRGHVPDRGSHLQLQSLHK